MFFFSVSPAPDQSGTNNWYPNRLVVTTNVDKIAINFQEKLKKIQSGIYNRHTVTLPGTEYE